MRSKRKRELTVLFRRQKDRYCIPASIQAVSNYLKPDQPITQDGVMDKYRSHGGTLDNKVGPG